MGDTKKFFSSLYRKLFKINDSTQNVALGLGIGVFSGILPGTGPIAAVFLASALGANRASALIGSLFTNTWLSIVTFVLSIKMGSYIMQINWQDVYGEWRLFFKDFHWLDLLKLSTLKLIFPMILGYFIIALSLGLLSYLITLAILLRIRYTPRASDKQ